MSHIVHVGIVVINQQLYDVVIQTLRATAGLLWVCVIEVAYCKEGLQLLRLHRVGTARYVKFHVNCITLPGCTVLFRRHLSSCDWLKAIKRDHAYMQIVVSTLCQCNTQVICSML